LSATIFKWCISDFQRFYLQKLYLDDFVMVSRRPEFLRQISLPVFPEGENESVFHVVGGGSIGPFLLAAGWRTPASPPAFLKRN
jgi:hypothetical protein